MIEITLIALLKAIGLVAMGLFLSIGFAMGGKFNQIVGLVPT